MPGNIIKNPWLKVFGEKPTKTVTECYIYIQSAQKLHQLIAYLATNKGCSSLHLFTDYFNFSQNVTHYNFAKWQGILLLNPTIYSTIKQTQALTYMTS